MRGKKIMIRVIYHVLMLAACVVMLYPLLWMISSSFKHTDDIMWTSDQLIIKGMTLENYATALKGFGRNTFWVFLKNTVSLSVISTFATLCATSITAFAFARIKFAGRKFWFALMIGTMCLPGMVLQIPKYIMFSEMGWVGTWKPLLIPVWFGGGAYNVFLLMQFMRGIPKELDEAAEIDGCGWFGLFKNIILPLIKPALATVAITVFISEWGDYYSALIYLNKPKLYPIAYALRLYTTEVGTNYGPMLAMGVMSITPILILFFCFQSKIVAGIATTGTKG